MFCTATPLLTSEGTYYSIPWLCPLRRKEKTWDSWTTSRTHSPQEVIAKASTHGETHVSQANWSRSSSSVRLQSAIRNRSSRRPGRSTPAARAGAVRRRRTTSRATSANATKRARYTSWSTTTASCSTSVTAMAPSCLTAAAATHRLPAGTE